MQNMQVRSWDHSKSTEKKKKKINQTPTPTPNKSNVDGWN
jgi:hypothetical protein